MTQLICVFFYTNSQADAHFTKMQHHVTGVKVHNLNKSFISTWTYVFHPDADITINCLVDVLKEVSKVIMFSLSQQLIAGYEIYRS